MLLHWGKRKWRQPLSLHEIFEGKSLPSELMKYIDEAKLHVYNMRSLPIEIRKRFHSDMRLVVDYLAEGTDYVPSGQRIVHVEALLHMMYVITEDDRYLKIIEDALVAEKEGAEITMCEILDGFIERGIRQGISQGITQGENLFASLMKHLFQDNRLEEAELVTTDETRRKELYREYGLV